MEVARIKVVGAHAAVDLKRTVTAGMIGAQIHIDYEDPVWDSLHKTVVFCGVETRDIVTDDPDVIIPAECIAKPVQILKVGVYGTDAENNLAIPTIWKNIGPVLDAADPSGDPSTDPTLPVWAQLHDVAEQAQQAEQSAKQAAADAQSHAEDAGNYAEDASYYAGDAGRACASAEKAQEAAKQSEILAGQSENIARQFADVAETFAQQAKEAAKQAEMYVKSTNLAPAIILTASGSDQADCSDAVAGRPFRRLCVYGHTNLIGTPTMDTPAQMQSDGAGGSILVETGTDTVEISVSGGLAGLHASKNGNFTDESGQQWWCDSIEYKDGAAVLVRRVRRLTLTGEETFVGAYYPTITMAVLPYANFDTSNGIICNYPIKKVYVPNAAGSTLGFKVDESQFPNVDAFKSWVKERYQSGDPVVVYYGLKTPVTEQLTDSEVAALAALTMSDQKLVYGENNEYFVVDYAADTKAYIDRKFEELSKALDALIGGGA